MSELYRGVTKLALDNRFVKLDGTTSLTANWDAGSFKITAETLESDVVTGTAPLTIASTTKVLNLNADLLDDQTGTHYLDSANFTGTNWTDLTDSGATTLHKHDHGGLDGLADDDHTIYALADGTRTFTGSVLIQNATNPSYLVTDTTNTVSSILQAQNTFGVIGTVSNHSMFMVTNAVVAWEVDNNQTTIFSGGSPLCLDNIALFLGSGVDSSILYDGTDLVINTSVAGSGTIKLNSANNWTANATQTITISNVGPAGIGTATIAKWLTVKDDSGVVFYIPAWT